MARTKTKKAEKPQGHIINCGNADDAYLAYMAMFRYAFGRMTYMPDVVIGIIKRNEDALTVRTLDQLDRELTEEAERYERMHKFRTADSCAVSSNYGMASDRQRWLSFHLWVKDQIAKRNGE